MHFFASISTEIYKNTSNPLHEYFRNREHWTKNTVSKQIFYIGEYTLPSPTFHIWSVGFSFSKLLVCHCAKASYVFHEILKPFSWFVDGDTNLAIFGQVLLVHGFVSLTIWKDFVMLWAVLNKLAFNTTVIERVDREVIVQSCMSMWVITYMWSTDTP